MPTSARTTTSVDLVCEGGGVKGIGLVGAIAVLEERGFRPERVAGTSAGAIVATLLASGYSAAELRAIILSLDFERFKDPTWQMRLPLAGGLASLLARQGLYKGDYLHQIMRHYLEAKGVRTFGDLIHPEPTNETRVRHSVQVIASDITGRQLLVLPRDARKIGIEPDELGVADAVRMSMSIPIYFTPVRVQRHVVVDGGLLSNFPVWLFDTDGSPRWPTFGLKLVEPNPRAPVGARFSDDGPMRSGLGAIVDYAKGLVATMSEFHDRLYLESHTFARTIAIPTLGIATTDFGLKHEQAEQLYEAGRGAAEKFLESWNFEGYIAAFRGGGERRTLADALSAQDS